MFRDLIGKAVRSTPGLRRVHAMVRGQEAAPAKTPSRPEPTLYGAETPRRAEPVKVEAPKVEAPKVEAPKVEAPKVEAPKVEAKNVEAPPPEAAPAKASKAPKKAKKAAAPVEEAPPAAEAAPHSARGEDELEALRLEAEQRKAEIRARKEAEAKAASAPTAVGGIAAMIAQTGGKVSEMANQGTVKAVNNWVPDDTDIHEADDGTPYWGSVDNDSSRAFARGETLIIDQWECINCGTCVENTDHVFVLPNDAKAVVIAQEGPMDLIQDAIDACPVTCIHWTTEPDKYEQTNDAEGNPLH
jgi:ferredoxin